MSVHTITQRMCRLQRERQEVPAVQRLVRHMRGQDLSGVLADIDARLAGWRAYMPRVAANDALGVAA